MNEQIEVHEKRIQELAAGFVFPVTPDVSKNVREQLLAENGRTLRSPIRLAWVILLVVILAAGLLLVPQVRAAVLRIFNIGAITIFEVEEMEELVGNTAVLNATKSPTPLPKVYEGVIEEISLDEALASTTLYWPTYPADLAEPDRIYAYRSSLGWPETMLFLWEDEDGAELVLYQIAAAQFAYKGATIVEETAVLGERAIWIEGPHFFRAGNVWQEWQFIEGNVLIWYVDRLTFRLEGAETFEEALRIAESLESVEE